MKGQVQQTGRNMDVKARTANNQIDAKDVPGMVVVLADDGTATMLSAGTVAQRGAMLHCILGGLAQNMVDITGGNREFARAAFLGFVQKGVTAALGKVSG